MKRYRRRNAKPNQLLAYYGKLPGDDPDIVFAWGGDKATKRHGNLLHYLLGSQRIEILHGEDRQRAGRDFEFGKTVFEMLDEAGCDLTTLKFSIEMKKQPEQG